MSTATAALIDRTERKWVLCIIVLALAAITLPYLWALLITPNGFHYGGLLYNPDDQNAHLAWAKQAAQGHLSIRDLFTTESLDNGEHPLFINLFCLVMGWLSLALPLILVYHLLRLVFAALALWWFYELCAMITADKKVRLIALTLAAFSMGSGWMLSFLPFLNNHTLIDRPDGNLMMPEAFTFSSAFVFPLNIAAMALMVFIYKKVMEAQEIGYLRVGIFAFIAAFLLSNIHTYDVIPLDITLLIWIVLNRQETRRRLVPGLAILGTLPPFLFQLLVFRDSSEFRIKALTKTLAPPISDVLLSYGLLFVLAVAGIVIIRRSRAAWLPAIWGVVTLLCIYAPVSFARKMIEGLHLPLCLLAAIAIVWLLARISSRPSRMAVAALFVAVLSLSSLQFVGWCLGNAQDNNVSRINVLMPPLYLSSDDMAALHWLAKQPREAEPPVVLCFNLLGNYVPRETGMFTYIGHWAETLNFPTKSGEVANIYSGRWQGQRALGWLQAAHVKYLVEGYYEKKMSDYDAGGALHLTPVFQQGGTTVYLVPTPWK